MKKKYGSWFHPKPDFVMLKTGKLIPVILGETVSKLPPFRTKEKMYTLNTLQEVKYE